MEVSGNPPGAVRVPEGENFAPLRVFGLDEGRPQIARTKPAAALSGLGRLEGSVFLGLTLQAVVPSGLFQRASGRGPFLGGWGLGFASGTRGAAQRAASNVFFKVGTYCAEYF